MTRPRLTLLGAEHPGPEGAGLTHQRRLLGAEGCLGPGRWELSLQLDGVPPQGGRSRRRELGCIEVAPGLFTPSGPALPLQPRREAQQSPRSSGPCLLAPLANLAGSWGGVLSFRYTRRRGPSPCLHLTWGPSSVHTQYPQAWGPPGNPIPVYLHFRETI